MKSQRITMEKRIYNQVYHIWREEQYLGTATWTQDKNVDDSFIKLVHDEKLGIIKEVYEADRWELYQEPSTN